MMDSYIERTEETIAKTLLEVSSIAHQISKQNTGQHLNMMAVVSAREPLGTLSRPLEAFKGREIFIFWIIRIAQFEKVIWRPLEQLV
jgi:hypothetical protein